MHSPSPSRLSLRYRAACEARAALEEARLLLAGSPPEAKGKLTLAVSAAAARYAEVARRYNEALLRCPE